MIMMQQMGFGLAVAVLLDATIVRTVRPGRTIPTPGRVLRYQRRNDGGPTW
jgi:hypothetical protein